MTGGPPLGQCTAAIPMTGTRMCPGRVTSSRRFASCSRIRSCCARLPPMRSFGAGASIVQEKSPRSNDAEPRASAGGKSPRGNAPRAPVPASAGHGHRARHHLPSAASHLQPRLGRKRVGQLRGESVGSAGPRSGKAHYRRVSSERREPSSAAPKLSPGPSRSSSLPGSASPSTGARQVRSASLYRQSPRLGPTT